MTRHELYIAILVLAVAFSGTFFLQKNIVKEVAIETAAYVPAPTTPAIPAQSVVVQKHISTPQNVRGIYVTGWVAGTKTAMDRIFSLIDTTDINTVIIDVKDSTGRISFTPLDPALIAIGAGTKRIANLQNLITKLHERGIYVVGRVVVFQDPYFANLYPETAFKDSRTGAPWRDNKGIVWLNAADKRVWEYTARVARDAYAQGFDEINLDYVRFPSDGPLAYLDTTAVVKNRAETMREFFAYMDVELRQKSAIVLSADIFGLVTSARGDLGIGQVLETIAPYVDYVAPMVYPSHYAVGSFGIASPAAEPYKIIYRAMGDGIKRFEAIGEKPEKMRAWLQDFDLGAVYTADMVRAQMRALNDLGLNSWMLWDPKNIYTKAAL